MVSRPLSRRTAAWFASTVAAVFLTLATPAARADGDPASDVLPGASVFYPYSPPVSAGLQRTLDAETAAAGREHFAIKVALIQSPADLGSVQSLFGEPQRYADFLEQEISFGAARPLLVVMPDGYGARGVGAPAARALASLGRPAGSGSDDLARAAITAVRAVASASGHRLPARGTAAGAHPPVELPIAVASSALVAAAGLMVLRWRRPRQPLMLAGLALMYGGLAWAAGRGLHFYGLAPLEAGYDLDQPPLLLGLVGAWLWHRSRRP